MGVLQRFEHRLERAVTGVFARTFRSAVQPVEIAAALQREVDDAAQPLSRDRRLAPNEFGIDLSAADYERMSAFGQTLSQELATMLHQHADEQGLVFSGPLSMTFAQADDLTTGRFRVRSSTAAQVTDHTAQPQPTTAPQPTTQPRPPSTPQPPPVPATPPARPQQRGTGVRLDINGTEHELTAQGIVVGRGTAADVQIDDPGVSRRHAEFRVQLPPDGRQTVSVLDLGSTNGTAVNGQRVQHALLRPGDVVQVGGTKITVFRAGDAPTSGGGATPGQAR